jgi:hypothetical protein
MIFLRRFAREDFLWGFAHYYLQNRDNRWRIKLASVTQHGSGRQNLDSFKTLQEPKNRPLEHFEIAELSQHPLLFQQFTSKGSRENMHPPPDTAAAL